MRKLTLVRHAATVWTGAGRAFGARDLPLSPIRAWHATQLYHHAGPARRLLPPGEGS
jgi:broad specificity phosphatase PhoE